MDVWLFAFKKISLQDLLMCAGGLGDYHLQQIYRQDWWAFPPVKAPNITHRLAPIPRLVVLCKLLTVSTCAFLRQSLQHLQIETCKKGASVQSHQGCCLIVGEWNNASILQNNKKSCHITGKQTEEVYEFCIIKPLIISHNVHQKLCNSNITTTEETSKCKQTSHSYIATTPRR